MTTLPQISWRGAFVYAASSLTAWRRLAPALFLMLLIVAPEMAAAQSSPLPAPTGPYAVGRTHVNWVDRSRPDPKSSLGARELVVWIWYPAARAGRARPAPWLPDKWASLFWEGFKRSDPDIAQSKSAQAVVAIQANSYSNALLARRQKTYPVLLFAPGKGEIPLKYASLLEDLASRGYVVVGVTPTYDSGFTVLSGGRVALDPPSDLRLTPGLTPDQARAKMAEIEAGIDLDVQRVSSDIRFALDQLAALNRRKGGLFSGRLDLGHVGVLGHSQGGAASLLAAKLDSRVRAVADLDGMLARSVAEGGLAKPVMVLSSDSIPKAAMARNPLMAYSRAMEAARPGLHLRLLGSTHYYSSDLGLLAFLPPSVKPGNASDPARATPREPGPMMTGPMMRSGTLDPVRGLAITRAYVAAFFDTYLRHKPSALLDGPRQDFPEVVFESDAPPAKAP